MLYNFWNGGKATETYKNLQLASLMVSIVMQLFVGISQNKKEVRNDEERGDELTTQYSREYFGCARSFGKTRKPLSALHYFNSLTPNFVRLATLFAGFDCVMRDEGAVGCLQGRERSGEGDRHYPNAHDGDDVE